MKTRLKQAVQTAATTLVGKTWVEKLKFYRAHRCLPNLNEPKTFNEKIVWRKLNDRDPLMQQYVDKCLAKQIVRELVGPQVIIPTLEVYDRVDDVSLDWPLPFVVKCTHASATNIFVQQEEDKRTAIKRLRRFFRYNHARRTNEWAYQIKPRVIVEPMLLVNGRKPNDFKLQVFDGKVTAIQVDTDRYTPNHRRIYYTPQWEMMDLRLTIPRSDPIPKPEALDEMIRIAELIGKQFTYARVDLYEGPLFGEVTFYPGAGYEKFYPHHWDRFLRRSMDLAEKELGRTAQQRHGF
ncbi:MAG: ATP-grasp fold amidoligase family protein [Pirellulaceae bacterium]